MIRKEIHIVYEFLNAARASYRKCLRRIVVSAESSAKQIVYLHRHPRSQPHRRAAYAFKHLRRNCNALGNLVLIKLARDKSRHDLSGRCRHTLAIPIATEENAVAFVTVNIDRTRGSIHRNLWLIDILRGTNSEREQKSEHQERKAEGEKSFNCFYFHLSIRIYAEGSSR